MININEYDACYTLEEAGKLLVKEILHNTHDNTGLINEISI